MIIDEMKRDKIRAEKEKRRNETGWENKEHVREGRRKRGGARKDEKGEREARDTSRTIRRS